MDQQVRELREAFAVFDADAGGTISFEELGDVLAQMGHVISESDLKKIIANFDTDGDGEISFDEFTEMMGGTGKKDPDEENIDELKEAFAVFDADSSGSITAQEIFEVVTSLGEEVTLKDCELMVKSVDTDGSGKIELDEFKAMMIDRPH